MRIVITGAAGQIASEIVKELSPAHDLCLIDRYRVSGRSSIRADLSRWYKYPFRFRPTRWRGAFKGADVVLHLAADRSPQASWENVLRHNVNATWNVCEAALKYGVPRVVFASSNYAVKALERALAPGCYDPVGPKIDSDAALRPITPYGVSKAAGELIGKAFVAEKKLDSFVAVRIGVFSSTPPKKESLRNLWISPGDIRSLFRHSVEKKFSGFHVVYGVSAQPTAPYDLAHTCRLLSWQPLDNHLAPFRDGPDTQALV